MCPWALGWHNMVILMSAMFTLVGAMCDMLCNICHSPRPWFIADKISCYGWWLMSCSILYCFIELKYSHFQGYTSQAFPITMKNHSAWHINTMYRNHNQRLWETKHFFQLSLAILNFLVGEWMKCSTHTVPYKRSKWSLKPKRYITSMQF